MLGVHTIIDLDDGATVIIQTPHCNRTAQRKMIAGSGELFDVEALASRGFAPLKTVAIKTGLTTQTNRIFVGNLGLKDFGRLRMLA